MEERRRARLGFVGAGSMGQCAHLKNYATIPACEIVALAELRPKLARAVAARYGIPRVYGNHAEMLAREHLDGIVASQQFTRHGLLVPELLAAGVPVFIEKPLAGSVETGEKIVAAEKASGTRLMVGYHKRSDPAVMAAKEEIVRLRETGELGAMKYVRILMPPGDWIAGGFDDLVRTEERVPAADQDPPPCDLSGEMYAVSVSFVNYYIHQVNLLRHLLGEQYRVTHAEPSGVLLVGRSVGGIACAIEMSPYRTTVGWQESALMCFEKGWVKVEFPAPLASNRPGRVTFFRDPDNGVPPETIVPHLPAVSAMRQQALNFLAAIEGRNTPLTTAGEALEDLKAAREYLWLWKGV